MDLQVEQELEVAVFEGLSNATSVQAVEELELGTKLLFIPRPFLRKQALEFQVGGEVAVLEVPHRVGEKAQLLLAWSAHCSNPSRLRMLTSLSSAAKAPSALALRRCMASSTVRVCCSIFGWT